MKTTKTITSEINQLIKEAGEPISNSVKNKVSFLRQCIRYIETKPTQKFINNEIKRLKYTIDILEERFIDWKPKIPTEYPYREYCKETELKKLKNQLKTLKYLK